MHFSLLTLYFILFPFLYLRFFLSAVILRPGLGELHRPTRVTVLLAQLRRLVLPGLGNRPRLDGCLLVIRIALLRRGNQRRIDDLAAHRQIAGRIDRPVEPFEQPVQRLGRNQRLAEVPQRVGVGNRVARAKPAKPHPAQAITHHIARLGQGQAVQAPAAPAS